jgi:pimeloyl-ACP methyl ester carboxylesterase
VAAPARSRGRRIWTLVRRAWITIGLTGTAIFAGWSLWAYRATDEARVALRSDMSVIALRTPDVMRFRPTDQSAPATVGLIFFPGALVDPVAYAPLARAVAAAGFPVTIVALPRRGAFGGADDPALFERAAQEMRRSGAPRRWVIAGHSRGAVVSTEVAASRPPAVVGLVLLGTTHPRDADLSALTIPVTKVVGTRDRIAPLEKIEANRRLLPASTRWIRIEGGNHSQFGWYGFQPFDGFAEISAEAQHAQVIGVVIEMLRRVAG